MGRAPASSGIDSKAGRGCCTYPHYHKSGGEHAAENCVSWAAMSPSLRGFRDGIMGAT